MPVDQDWIANLLSGFTELDSGGTQVAVPAGTVVKKLNLASGITAVYNAATGAYDLTASSGGGASVGLASARPSATGSGKTYCCSDSPIEYVDDPNTASWKQFVFGRPTVGPGALSNYTICGNAALTQFADSLEFLNYSHGASVTQSALRPSGALGGSAAWSVSVKGSWQSAYGQTDPIFGVSVSNGTTTGTSTVYTGGLFSSSSAVGGATLSSMTAGGARISNLVDSTAVVDIYISPILNFRLLNDGTLLHFQGSQDGYHWQDFAAIASVSGFTDYGFTIGDDYSSGVSDGQQAFVYENLLATPATGTVTGTTSGTPGSIQMSTTDVSKFRSGDIVSVNGVSGATGCNNSANTSAGFGAGSPQWSIQVLSTTSIRLINSTIGGVWTSGGVVTLLSR